MLQHGNETLSPQVETWGEIIAIAVAATGEPLVALILFDVIDRFTDPLDSSLRILREC